MFQNDLNQAKNTLRKLLKSFQFATASDEIKLDGMSLRQLKLMIDSWSNYPACMDVYPKYLSKKPVYDEEIPVNLTVA